jgi:hypothetical protein
VDERLAGWSSGWMIGCMTNCLIHCLSDWLLGWQNEWLADHLSEWLAGWPTNYLIMIQIFSRLRNNLFIYPHYMYRLRWVIFRCSVTHYLLLNCTAIFIYFYLYS